MILPSVIALLIPAGLAMLVTGLTRAKNATQTAFMVFIGGALATLGLWAVGFRVMGGGTDAVFLYRAVQAGIVVAIPVGVLAERWSLKNFFLYAIFAATLLFPVAVLGSRSLVDFAGAGSVHVVGGFSALAGAVVLGPRIGRYNRDGVLAPIPAHNVPLALLGCFVLTVGWLGINTGDLPAEAPRLAMVTLLAGAAGAVAAAAFMIFSTRRPDPTIAVNGLVAGLVSSSAAVAIISPAAGVITGGVAGVLVCLMLPVLDRKHIDDPVGAIAAHGVAGLWGVIAAGIFARREASLGVQALGGVALAAWAFGISWLFFKIAGKFLPMRVAPEVELEGLDLSETGVVGYPEFQRSNVYGSGLPFGATPRK